MSADLARKTWELENKVTLVDPVKDFIYGFDEEEQKTTLDAKPWKANPDYFKSVRISAVALLKMTMHARSGGSIEIMGLMVGRVHGTSFIVSDAFPLPVEGTETRVNAQNEAYEYMAEADRLAKEIGRKENVVGWYHSHPGYGCWLSGIDVNTQMMQQQWLDPFLAVVIDPDRTISAGKVDIGAFRTYPEGHKQAGGKDAEYQTIPLSKIEDFGAHSNQYYPLEITHYKSSLDNHLLELLWHKYWVSTLSQSPLFTNREYSSKQMAEISRKIKKAETQLSHTKIMFGGGGRGGFGGGGDSKGGKDNQLSKIVRDSNKIANEEICGLLSTVVKERIFDFSNLKLGKCGHNHSQQSQPTTNA
ncbi:COP9 signalosome catalytic subunit rri1 [Orbilia blumenaviensis]|uniref:COP9 signalosome complex subunit 5 n=1 Tax=Orbilia blumenaviensis TaxID=1796055 RepID=A0AAV9VNJ4_9PEZI